MYRLLLPLLLLPVLAAAESKLSLGWVETVLLDPRLGLQLDAKLDTGADTSSLDARNIRRVRVGEKRYVRFAVRDPETDELVELRKPYVRRVRIKRHSGDYQRRYVVRMQVCIGDRTRNIEINLIDRGNFDYPMLLGRSALAGWALVDPDLQHVTEPGCWRKAGSMPDDDAANPPDDDAAEPPEDGAANPQEVDSAKPPEDGAANPQEGDSAKPPEDGAANPQEGDSAKPTDAAKSLDKPAMETPITPLSTGNGSN